MDSRIKEAKRSLFLLSVYPICECIDKRGYQQCRRHQSLGRIGAIAGRKNRYDFYVGWEAIKLAGELNALSDEIQYQSQQVGSLFNRQMIETREVLTLATQLFLGMLIGAMVIAMYLPIFLLGSAI